MVERGAWGNDESVVVYAIANRDERELEVRERR